MTVLTDITESPVFGLGIDNTPKTGEPAGVASSLAIGTPSAVAVVNATSVAGSTTVGTALSVAVVDPDGVASGEAVGTAVTVAGVTVAGIGSGVTFGAPAAFTSMGPAGFSATGGGPGSPAVTLTMGATGIASTAAIGDADTIATVFIIPGPVDPSNDFGNAQVFKKGWIFRTPFMTYQYRYPPQKQYEGISLLKESGVWSEIPHPDLARTLDAQLYLAGGRDHVVSTTLKAELEGLGYTVTEEAVTTEVVIS